MAIAPGEPVDVGRGDEGEQAGALGLAERAIDGAHAAEFGVVALADHPDELVGRAVDAVDNGDAVDHGVDGARDAVFQRGLQEQAEGPDACQHDGPAEEILDRDGRNSVGVSAAQFLDLPADHCLGANDPLNEPDNPDDERHGKHERQDGEQSGEEGGKDAVAPDPVDESSHGEAPGKLSGFRVQTSVR